MEKINKSILVNVIVPFTGEIRKNMRASGYVEDGHEFYMVDEQMENDECEVVDEKNIGHYATWRDWQTYTLRQNENGEKCYIVTGGRYD